MKINPSDPRSGPLAVEERLFTYVTYIGEFGFVTPFEVYKQDSITKNLRSPDHFYLCNRLYLLNLATIYTTGFEYPQTDVIITELDHMLSSVKKLYDVYNISFSSTQLSPSYLSKYEECINFVKKQSKDFETFDHFTFVKDFVNPLFAMNQQMLIEYKVKSNNYVDYSLSNDSFFYF